MTSAALIAVGDELLAGAHPDLNSPVLARRLGELGIPTVGVAVVGDDEERIAAAVRGALGEADLVFLTGGLGPTLDDVTRHAVAHALGRELVCDDEALRGVEAWFERRGVPMPDANRRQALMPAGADRIDNRVGTAPGFRVAEGDAVIVSLPGPPPEMRTVLEEEVAPWLIETGRGTEPLAERRFHLFGIAESAFAELAGEWMARDAEPRMGCSAKKGVLTVVLRARGSRRDSRLAVERRAVAFRERFGPHVFSEEEPRLENVLVGELLATGTTITTAESCTGGLVAALLTRVPGVSAVFARGFVTYSNEAKQAELGVAGDLLERHGAVSGEVAEAMAAGAARASGARLAVAVTGVAGPSGGSDEKPVGTVCFATWLDGEVRSVTLRFPPGEREWVRTLAARTALHLCLLRLRGPAQLD